MAEPKSKKKLDKVLNGKDVLVTAFGAMIGWGWVVSTGDWLQKAGSLGTIIGFIIGGIMIYFVGLTYSELTTMMPRCGGEHVFTHKAFGPLGSFICTWAIILSYIGVVCFEACSLPTIVQYIWPGFLKGYMYTVAGFDIYVTWVILAVLVAILITYINIRGIKTAAILQTVLTFTIAGVGIILVFASAINGSPNNLDGQLLLGNGTGTFVKNILSIAVVAPFFLFGFDVIPQVAEEINVPLKKLGKLLILSIVLAVLFYALIVFSVSYAISPMEVDASRHSTGLVTADAMAKVFNSKIMAKVAIIGGMCGIITSWNSFLIGGSRALFALAESYMIPHCFSKLHPKYNTPVLSLLLIGVLSVISPFFGKSMLVWISNSASFACCIAYCMVSISFLVLRKKMANEPRPYKVKHFKFVGVMAIFMAGFMVLVYIFPWFGCNLVKQEWIIIGGWGTLGIIFSAICKMVYKDKYGVML